MFNSFELGQITLESVLIIVIVLITLNLLFIVFYILNVLRELKKTLTRARGMMEEVDRSVKSGMDKFIAIERPLEALSSTTNALAGFLKGNSVIKKATQSILNSTGNTSSTVVDQPATSFDLEESIEADFETEEMISEPKHAPKPKVTHKSQSKVQPTRGAQTEDEFLAPDVSDLKEDSPAPEKKASKKPRFFK